MTQPLVTYSNISINGQSISLGGTGHCSFVSPYNSVSITFTPTNVSLSRFMIRVTKSDQECGLNEGTCPVSITSIAQNTQRNVIMTVNSTYFQYGDTTYRVLLCSQNSVDGSWDITDLFMSLNGSSHDRFVPSGSDGLETIVQTSVN